MRLNKRANAPLFCLCLQTKIYIYFTAEDNASSDRNEGFGGKGENLWKKAMETRLCRGHLGAHWSGLLQQQQGRLVGDHHPTTCLPRCPVLSLPWHRPDSLSVSGACSSLAYTSHIPLSLSLSLDAAGIVVRCVWSPDRSSFYVLLDGAVNHFFFFSSLRLDWLITLAHPTRPCLCQSVAAGLFWSQWVVGN